MHYTYIDYIEIGLFSVLLYRTSVWLKQDLTRNLLGYYWGYLAAIIITYTFRMMTLFTCALWLCPVLIVVFFLIHRDTIQKYFVVIPQISPKTSDWHDALIKSLLHGFSSSISTYIILENDDSILHHLSIECPIESTVNTPLLSLVIHSTTFNSQKYIILAKNGRLIGCNSSLIHNFSKNHKENALLFTAHTDALIIHADAQKRHFILYKDAQQYPACNAVELEEWLKKSYRFKGIENAKPTQVPYKERTP